MAMTIAMTMMTTMTIGEDDGIDDDNAMKMTMTDDDDGIDDDGDNNNEDDNYNDDDDDDNHDHAHTLFFFNKLTYAKQTHLKTNRGQNTRRVT